MRYNDVVLRVLYCYLFQNLCDYLDSHAQFISVRHSLTFSRSSPLNTNTYPMIYYYYHFIDKSVKN